MGHNNPKAALAETDFPTYKIRHWLRNRPDGSSILSLVACELRNRQLLMLLTVP